MQSMMHPQMDELLLEYEEIWKDRVGSYPWDRSPLRGVPLNQRQDYLDAFLSNAEIPPGYPATHEPTSQCNVLLQHVKLHIKDHPTQALRAYPVWDGTCICQHILYDILSSVTTPEDLFQEIYTRAHGFRLHVCVDHLLEKAAYIPECINNSPTCNFVLENSPRSGPSMFAELGEKCHLLYTPVMYSRKVNPHLLDWILHNQQHTYPFGYPGDLVELSKDGSDDIRPLQLALILRTGGFQLCDWATTALLKTYSFDQSTACGRYLRQYVADALKDGLCHVNTQLFQYIQGDGPSNEAMTIITSYCTGSIAEVVLQYILEVPLSKANKLNIDYWVLYFHHKGYFTRAKTRDVSAVHIADMCKRCKRVDPRVIDYIFPAGPLPCTFTSTRTFPEFGKPTDLVLVFVTKTETIEVHVYREQLLSSSKFLEELTAERGFKRLRGLDSGVLHLECSLPDHVGDPQSTMNQWLAHCYTGLLPAEVTISEICDLHSVADYFMDEECLQHTTAWLEREYIVNFHQHKCCGTTCPVCSVWVQGKTQ